MPRATRSSTKSTPQKKKKSSSEESEKPVPLTPSSKKRKQVEDDSLKEISTPTRRSMRGQKTPPSSTEKVTPETATIVTPSKKRSAKGKTATPPPSTPPAAPDERIPKPCGKRVSEFEPSANCSDSGTPVKRLRITDKMSSGKNEAAATTTNTTNTTITTPPLPTSPSNKAHQPRLKRGRSAATTTTTITTAAAANNSKEEMFSMADEEATENLKPCSKRSKLQVDVVEKKSPIIVYKAPLPRRLTNQEMYQEFLDLLSARLDNFDLSDTADSKNLFCDWPTVDFSLDKSSRVWYSSQRDHSSPDLLASGVVSLNGGDVSANGKNGRHSVSSSSASSSSNSVIDGGNGGGRRVKTQAAEFTVLSYSLPHLHASLADFAQQKERLLAELKQLDADILCFNSVDQSLAVHLKEIFATALTGYAHSGLVAKNFIAYRVDQFDRLGEHQINGSDLVSKLIKSCAYPPAWRDSLDQALVATSANLQVFMLALKHRHSGMPLLVASQSSPSSSSRPDISAINITGIMWSISRIWQEEMMAYSTGAARWILCGPLNATQESPIYQLARDGYPSDDTLNRLRCVKSVNIPTSIPLHQPPMDPEEHEATLAEPLTNGGLDKKALVDLMWHAFQHPCTDVVSCYQAILGREPPFTRLPSSTSNITTQAGKLTKCIDYIWCSGSTLQAKSVLLPACRQLVLSKCPAVACSLPSELPAIALMAKMAIETH